MIATTDGVWYYVSFFNAGTLANATLGDSYILNSGTLVLSNDPQIADAALGVDPQQSDGIRFVLTDRIPIDPALRYTTVGKSGLQLTLGATASDFAALIVHTTESIPQSLGKIPLHFVVTPIGALPTAYVLTEDQYLWRLQNYLDPVQLIADLFLLTSELTNPLVIAIDETATSLTGGNAAGTTADLSTYIP